MGKKVFRLLLLFSYSGSLALPFAFANSTYPKTASCPIDGGTAHATGKKRTATQTACTEIEYKHKGTDYSDPAPSTKIQSRFLDHPLRRIIPIPPFLRNWNAILPNGHS